MLCLIGIGLQPSTNCVCADVFCIPDIYVIIIILIFYFFLGPANVLLVSSHLWQINIVVLWSIFAISNHFFVSENFGIFGS